MVEGGKNVGLLLASDYTVQMVVGTATFLETHVAFGEGCTVPVYQADEAALASLGTFNTNNAALAVVAMPPDSASPPSDAWGLVLDDIQDPGNLGAIIRIADWYNIPSVICSPTTVERYNPKVLHASMGSFTRVAVHHTPLAPFLSHTSWPILGTFTMGDDLHHTPMPLPGLIVIGNESRGISTALLPYIQQRITIPRYGQAESLNAAMAAAVVCDCWRR